MLLGETLVLGHRVVGHNFALKDPNLDPADTVGGESRAFAIIYLGTQGMKRHPTFAVPLGTGDLGTAKTACAVDPDTLRSKTCLLYTSPSPRDRTRSRMPSSA